MNDLALAFRQARYTNKAFWRNPASAFFTFLFPLMFLVIFTALFGNDKVNMFGQRISASTFYVSAIATFSIITATFTNLAMSVSFQRDAGVLKRTRGTPLPGWAYIVGRVAHALFVAFLLAVIVVAFGAAFYHAQVPSRTLLAFVVTIVVGASSFSALGMALTAAIPNADAAPAVVNAVILPLLFLSDIFIPIRDPHAWYANLAKVFPVYHFAEAMKRAYFSPTGRGWSGGDLLVIGIWGLAAVALGALFFSWEPRR